METQKTLKSQSNLEKENISGGISFPGFGLYKKLQSSKQYGTSTNYRSMEKDRKPRNKPMYLWLINL